MNALASLLTHSLAWALLHSLWQGLLVFGAMFLLLKAMPDMNARVKYYLSLSALLAIALWFAATWVSHYQKLKDATSAFFIKNTGPGTGITPPVQTDAVERTVHSSAVSHILLSLEQYFPFILALYTTGLFFMLFRFLVNIAQVRGLRTQGLILLPPKYHELLASCRERLGIGRRAEIFLSNRITVPMMLGTLKPIILLPLATMNHLTTEQVEAILLHELAHIKRHDYLVNIFQTIAETILFFNPFVWLTSSIIRKEREHCCDDLVVACSANPLPYARALTILEHLQQENHSIALAATGHNNHLFNRIKRIMEMKKSNINYSQIAIILVAIIAISVSISLFTFTPSFAQKAKGDKSDTTKQKPVYKYKTVTVDNNGKKKVMEKTSSTPINDDDNTNVDVNVSITDDDASAATSANGTTVSTRTVRDSSGKKVIIKERTISHNKGEERKSIDEEKMREDMAQMGRDLKEMVKDLANASIEISSVNWDEIAAEIKKGLRELEAELNDPKLRREVKIEMQKAMEKSEEALAEAKREIAKAKKAHASVTITTDDEDDNGGHSYEAMIEKMGKDGIIDRSGSFTIKKDDGVLYINGEQQGDKVYSKYRSYLKDDKVTIKKSNNGSLRITINN